MNFEVVCAIVVSLVMVKVIQLELTAVHAHKM